MRPQTPIVLLLAAATLCATVVAFQATDTHFFFAYVIYFALLSVQLSVVCVWSALRPANDGWTRAAPWLALATASLAFGLVELDQQRAGTQIVQILPYFGLHVLLVLVLLWFWRRSRWWRDRVGAITDWQFSVAQLLGIMTAVALLSVALRYSDVFVNDTAETAMLLAFTVLLTLALVFLWTRGIHWFLRLAASLLVALLCGLLFIPWGEFMFEFAMLHFLVHALVLVIWLAWGGILPVRQSPAAIAGA